MPDMHPDDRFHPATDDDPYWTETCWWTFAAPAHKLSGQLYPFFRGNQNVAAAGAFFWDDSGHQPHTIRFGKNFWHLPIPDQDLTDIALANGIRIRCLEPMQKFELHYLDPDAQEAEANLTFTAIAPPNYLADSHFEQPGRYQGTIRLADQTYAVDSYGMRDRSWSHRTQFGADIHGSGAVANGYSYATADDHNAFHMISMAFTEGDYIQIHGYYMRDGEYAKLASGKRRILERDPETGCPTRVLIEAEDTLGRSFTAEGRGLNKLGFHINPNLFTWNCLTHWQFDGLDAYGEDHDNWTAAGARHFFRRFLGLEKQG